MKSPDFCPFVRCDPTKVRPKSLVAPRLPNWQSTNTFTNVHFLTNVFFFLVFGTNFDVRTKSYSLYTSSIIPLRNVLGPELWSKLQAKNSTLPNQTEDECEVMEVTQIPPNSANKDTYVNSPPPIPADRPRSPPPIPANTPRSTPPPVEQPVPSYVTPGGAAYARVQKELQQKINDGFIQFHLREEQENDVPNKPKKKTQVQFRGLRSPVFQPITASKSLKNRRDAVSRLLDSILDGVQDFRSTLDTLIQDTRPTSSEKYESLKSLLIPVNSLHSSTVDLRKSFESNLLKLK